MQPEEQEIQVRWPDTDQLGHLNHSVVLTYLEVGRDAVLARKGISPYDYVVRHCAVDYVRELRPRRPTVRYRLTGVTAGTTSLTLTEELLDDSGAIAVAATFTLVMWDRTRGTSRKLTDIERRNLFPTE